MGHIIQRLLAAFGYKHVGEEPEPTAKQPAKQPGNGCGCGYVGIMMLATRILWQLDSTGKGRVVLRHHVKCPSCLMEGTIDTRGMIDINNPCNELESEQAFAVWDAEAVLAGAVR